MAIIKCKMCGGDLRIEEGSTVCECEYCGTRQTVPSADNEKKLTLFSRAGRLLRGCEFDKAAGVFETIVADFPEEAEAYWGLVLCKYGIEYVDDPATGKKIPTCHRSSFDSVLDDPNYEQACENTDAVARRVYRDEARQIEDLRKRIIEVSGKEEPYDVFISYKETDEHGDRTLDSVIAQDIYTELTEKGYRVFFSRISLEDKLGTEYEPYIFAALNSAKVMLVVGTDYENFDAVWVKNEWSRFLKLIASGQKKTLIPVFKNMDAYDMPKEFAKLAAQDMGKVGAMQDLVRGVDKLVKKKENVFKELVKETVIVRQNGESNIVTLLKRMFMFLADGDFKSADNYCERILDQDPENAQAYLGKLMAEKHVHRQEWLANCKKPFDDSINYQRAVRYGDENLSSALKGYINHINERNENERVSDIYSRAVISMNTATTQAAYNAAEELLKLIPGFKDADELAEKCLEEAEKCRKKEEESRRRSEDRARRTVLAVAEALMAGGGSKREPTLEEKLAVSKTRIGSLTELKNCFDALLVQMSHLQHEQATLTSREAELSTQREKLGIFAGKERKRINDELSIIDSRKHELADQISQNSQLCCGYRSKADIDIEIAKESAVVSALEAQIADVANSDIVYSFEQAINAYLKEPDLIREVNAIYPAAGLIPAIFGKNDSVFFGRYIQRENSTPEPIEWKVLERTNGRILVISKYVLDCRKYNRNYSGVTWETCSLRKWLNDTFINEAFNADEQTMIPSVTVSAGMNKIHGTSAGNCTTDRVFLLSITEANKYFTSDSARQSKGTAYFDAHSKYKTYNGGCWWWLRTPGNNYNHSAGINAVGSVDYNGSAINGDGGVRPVLWIDTGA